MEYQVLGEHKFKKGQIPWIKGKLHSQASRLKISEKKKGKTWDQIYGKDVAMRRKSEMRAYLKNESHPARKTRFKPRYSHIKRDWLYQRYQNEKLTLKQISKLINSSSSTVYRLLVKYNIPLRSFKYKNGCRVAENHPKWKGGIRKINGYISIYSPNHPFVNKNRYVLEHRLVMERHLGRYLFPWEVIHHINGKKDDNRIENLQLISCAGQHNTVIQKIYKENQDLKKALLFLLLLFKHKEKSD